MPRRRLSNRPYAFAARHEGGMPGPAMGDARPEIAAIVISDYGGHDDAAWDYLRATLRALARQVENRTTEILLVDATPAAQRMPADVAALIPGVRIVADRSATTPELLNAAARATSAPLVALLDADCVPAPSWLDAARRTMDSHPEAVAASGRTVYPMHRLDFRILAALSRAYLDPGGAGETSFISGNNAVVRRDVLLAHPLGPYRRPLAARLQTEAIRRTGGKLRFAPEMHVEHRFEGWAMERRIRHRVGYRAIRVRQLEPDTPYAWLLRLGPLVIPVMLGARIVESWLTCARVGRHYGVRWFEQPIAFATAIAVHLLEVGGMRGALADGRTGAPRTSLEASS
jgi:hypothetical protein